MVTGKVLDVKGKPVANAFVAAYGEKHDIVASAHTNKVGEYSLAVPRSALHVDKKGKPFFTQVSAGFNRAFALASTINPVAGAITTGSKLMNKKDTGDENGPTIVVDSALTSHSDGKTKKITPQEAEKLPGALMIKVVSPRYRDLTAVTQAYWIQQEVSGEGAKAQNTIVAWMDPVPMVPDSADTKVKPVIKPVPIDITDAHLTPSLVKHGDTVRVTAKLITPTDPKIYAVVVARDSLTGEIWELKPVGKGMYGVDILIDDAIRPNDQFISILAYASETDRPVRRPELEAAIEKAGLWNTKRPYVCNPLYVVSRNRADLTLTVVPDPGSPSANPQKRHKSIFSKVFGN